MGIVESLERGYWARNIPFVGGFASAHQIAGVRRAMEELAAHSRGTAKLSDKEQGKRIELISLFQEDAEEERISSWCVYR